MAVWTITRVFLSVVEIKNLKFYAPLFSVVCMFYVAQQLPAFCFVSFSLYNV